MKKFLYVLLILSIILSIFTGCSKNDEKLQNNSETTFLTTNIIQPTPKTKIFSTEKHEIYKHIKGNIKEEKIFEQKGILITAKGFDFSTEDARFVFEIENNSKYTYEFDVDNITVNNFMAYAMINKKLASGEKREIAMTFTDNNLFAKRIETIEDISFTIEMSKISKKQPYKKISTGEIYLTTGLNETNAIEEKLGQKIIDTKDIKMYYLDMETTEENTILYFYTENKNTQPIIVSTPKSKATIGDKKVKISFSQHVLSYKKNIGKLIIKNEELTEIDKSKITSIITEFMVVNKNTHATILKCEEYRVNTKKN